MELGDFDYYCPDALIAQKPLPHRVQSRLLIVDPALKEFHDGKFRDLPTLLNTGDLLVFNDTRVIPARLYGYKQSGARIEVLVERVIDEQRLLAQIRSNKSPRAGSALLLEDRIHCTMTGREGDLFVLQQDTEDNWLQLLERYGHIPLPPYINRADEAEDRERYQTVYARNPGAVAAPTAGLHFDRALIDSMENQGVNTAFVTLHVGAGTFQPIRAESIDQHVMHAERIQVTGELCEAVRRTRESGNRVVAVGTTVVRSLEAAAASGQLLPLKGESSLFIKPGFKFNVIDAMITNFHLPKSTLLMLVSAFAGTETIRRAYTHAVANQYRFFSYGDAMLIVSRGCM